MRLTDKTDQTNRKKQRRETTNKWQQRFRFSYFKDVEWLNEVTRNHASDAIESHNMSCNLPSTSATARSRQWSSLASTNTTLLTVVLILSKLRIVKLHMPYPQKQKHCQWNKHSFIHSFFQSIVNSFKHIKLTKTRLPCSLSKLEFDYRLRTQALVRRHHRGRQHRPRW